MENALWITLIGMGLVFVAILFLWGLMALLVWLTQEREPARSEPKPAAQPAAQDEVPDPIVLLERKRRAAAAAYVAALSIRKVKGAAARPALVSAWQAVQRASLISQRSDSSRKKVSR
jgi:hypothetical protein